MSDSPPTPPRELPSEIGRALAEQSPTVLRAVARYANELADYREPTSGENSRDSRSEHSQEGPTGPSPDESGSQSSGRTDDQSVRQGDELAEDRPDGVPSKATITVKKINDNRYYYWQWRDGDQIKSKYKGPVDADD